MLGTNLSSNASPFPATLVLGATGATGRRVVQQLLQQGRPVHVIVRSKDRIFAALPETSRSDGRLTVTEASFLDLTDAQIQQHVRDVGAVVSCLGHHPTPRGIWGAPRRLCTDATTRLAVALANTVDTDSCRHRRRLVVMSADGVAHPAGSDDRRKCGDRLILACLRRCLPPHVDNEAAAAHLYNLVGTGNMEWTVVRPTNLTNSGKVSDYELFSKPQGSLFGGGSVTRSNVAKCMVDLVTNDALWEEYKFRMPVVLDAALTEASAKDGGQPRSKKQS